MKQFGLNLILFIAIDTIQSITKDWSLQDRACCVMFHEVALKQNLM